MQVHKIAALGRLRTGILLTMNQLLSTIKNLGAESLKQADLLSQQAGGKNNELTHLRTILTDLNQASEKGI